jgi:hypothetical protein
MSRVTKQGLAVIEGKIYKDVGVERSQKRAKQKRRLEKRWRVTVNESIGLYMPEPATET